MKWNSATGLTNYYHKMSETLTEMQKEWIPSPHHTFTINKMEQSELLTKYATMVRVITLKEKGTCYTNGDRLITINTKHRVGNPAKLTGNNPTWITFLPNSKWLMLSLSAFYPNVKECVSAIHDMTNCYIKVSATMRSLEPLLLHLYALRAYGRTWDYDADCWVKLANKMVWFNELKKMMQAKGHIPADSDLKKVYLEGAWTKKYECGVLIKNLRGMVQ